MYLTLTVPDIVPIKHSWFPKGTWRKSLLWGSASCHRMGKLPRKSSLGVVMETTNSSPKCLLPFLLNQLVTGHLDRDCVFQQPSQSHKARDRVLINGMQEGAVHTTHGSEPLKQWAASSTLSLPHFCSLKPVATQTYKMAQEMMKKNVTKIMAWSKGVRPLSCDREINPFVS